MKIIKNILAIIGGIFLALTLLAAILIIFKPYGVNVIKVISAVLDENPKSSYDHPYLTIRQELLLESVGIDPKNVPTQITPELQKCATLILSDKRLNEIISGSSPTISELLKLKNCLK
jgi:hypothetical protein